MKYKLSTTLLILFGLLGGGLRIWALNTSYTPDTKLEISGALPLLLLKCFIAAALLLSFVFSRILISGSMSSRWQQLYTNHNSSQSALGCLSTGFLIVSGLWGAIRVLLQLTTALTVANVLDFLAWCLLFTCAFASIQRSASSKTGRRSILPILTGFAVSFRLVLYYHANSRDPVVSRYMWILLALLAVGLALYFHACWSFDRGKPRRTLYASALGFLFCITALPDADGGAVLLLLLGLALLMLQKYLQLITGTPADPVGEQTAEAQTE